MDMPDTLSGQPEQEAPETPASSRIQQREHSRHTVVSYLRWVFHRKGLITAIAYSELKQTIIRHKLSYLWWIMDPLFNLACYVFLVAVLGRGSRMGIPYPLFLFSGLIPWKWTTGCIQRSSRLWIQYRATIAQIRFPYMILIFSRYLHELILYAISYIVLIGAFAFYGYYPTVSWLLVPLVILAHSLLILTMMFISSVMSWYLSDFERLLPFLCRLWFFSSPVLYSIDMLPAWARPIIQCNPMTFILVSYRKCILFGESPDLAILGIYIVGCLVFLYASMWIFIRKEPYVTKMI